MLNSVRHALLAALLLTTGNAVADDIDAGKIYRESCSVCHGDDGSGAVWGRASLASVPRDFTTESARAELTRERMIASISYGRPGTPMPGFGTQLNPQEVAAVADHIRQRFMPSAGASGRSNTGDDAQSSPVSGSMPTASNLLPNALIGDANAGREHYMTNCVACHGEQGRGDGPRAYFIFPKPRNFLDPATQARMSRPALFYSISSGVVGKEMPAWSKVMDEQQIADIAEFVYSEFIAAGDAASPASH